MAKNRGKKNSVKDSIIAETTMWKNFRRFSDKITLISHTSCRVGEFGFYFSKKVEIYNSSDEFDEDFGFSVTATGHNYIVEITLTNTGSKDLKISRFGLSGFPTLDQGDFVLQQNVPKKLNLQAHVIYATYGGKKMRECAGNQIDGEIQYFIELDGLFLIIVFIL
jgi:hypothetical protein